MRHHTTGALVQNKAVLDNFLYSATWAIQFNRLPKLMAC